MIGGFAFVSVFNFRTARSSITNEIVSSSLPLMRENIYSEIQKDFMPSLNIASVMATDSFLRNWVIEGEKEIEQIIQYLTEIRDEYGYFASFFVSDISNKYYYFDGVLKQISTEDDHDVWYYRFKDSGKQYDLDVDTNEAAENKLTIFINYRVDDFNGSFIGVTGVGIEMQNFSAFLQRQQEKYNRHIYLVDENKIIQAHSEAHLITADLLVNRRGIEAVADDLMQKRPEPVNTTYEGEEGTVLVTAKYMPELDWYLIVEQNEGEALTQVRRSLVRTVLIGRHYEKKHGSYMNDELILDLVACLNGGTYPVDSTTDGIEYYVADVELNDKVYRVIWLFEGDHLEVLGVVNAYRRKLKPGGSKL
jgi:hypothetical protein